MKKTLILYACVFVVTLVAGYFVLAAEEKKECLTWAKENNEYPDYKFARWQIAQCDSYQVFLPTGKLNRM